MIDKMIAGKWTWQVDEDARLIFYMFMLFLFLLRCTKLTVTNFSRQLRLIFCPCCFTAATEHSTFMTNNGKICAYVLQKLIPVKDDAYVVLRNSIKAEKPKL